MSKRAFDKIKDGIDEAITIARGGANPMTYGIHGDGVNPGSRALLRDLADRIAALTPKVPQTDSTRLVRRPRALTLGPLQRDCYREH